MMRNDTINVWNSAEQFLLGGIASELAVTFPAWRCSDVATQHDDRQQSHHPNRDEQGE
jgi:hypothetical protein